MSIWIVLLGCLALTLYVGVFMLWNVMAIVRGAPYVPSRKERIDAMVELAVLTPKDVVMDVGSGDGRILRRISALVVRAIGIEINPTLVWHSRLKNFMGNYKNIEILRKNFWNVSLADVDVLFVYCIDGKMTRLEEKIVREMRPGSRIVSNGFTLPTLQESAVREGVHLYVLSENFSVV